MLQITNWALGILIMLVGVLIYILDSFPRYKEEKITDDYRKCPKCGNKYYTYDSNCKECGTELQNESGETIKKVAVGGSLGIPVVAVAVLAGIILIVMANQQANTVGSLLNSSSDLLNGY